MMEATMGHPRRTGLTRAKRIERLSLMLGLPLLLLLLSLTAGIVNYTPVRQTVPGARVDPTPVTPVEQGEPTIQPLRAAPPAATDSAGELSLNGSPSAS